MQLFISLALKYYEVHVSEGGELDEPITKYRLVIWSIKKYFQKLRKIHSQILDHQKMLTLWTRIRYMEDTCNI